MKSLFWKNESAHLNTLEPAQQPRLEQGATFTFLPDQNLFLFIDGLKIQPQKKQIAPPAKKNPFAPKGATSVQDKLPLIEQVYLYNPKERLWRIQTCTGKCPTQRTNHYANYTSPYLLVYGGNDKKMYSDIYMLNSETWVWKKLVVLDSHVPRLYGCMVPYVTKKDNKRFLIGGTGSLQNVDVLSDIWALSLEGVVDSNNSELPGAFWTKIDYQNTNNSFNGIKNFTAEVISQNQAFLFGGFTSSSAATNSSYVFNMRDCKMRALEPKGVKPSPRGNHRSCLIKPNFVVICGGQLQPQTKTMEDVFLYHIDIDTWQKVVPGGNSPQNLSCFVVSGVCNEAKGQMVLFGSTVGQGCCQYLLEQLVGKEEFKVVSKVAVSQQIDYNNVSEDLEEGYAVNEEQKVKIKQLQKKLARLRDHNTGMKEMIEQTRAQPLPSQERYEGNKAQLTTKLLNLLLLEHKKRKFLQLKSVMLQNTIKDAQKLVVLLDGYSQPDAKAKHIRLMKNFRVQMEEVWDKEKLLRKEINKKKNLMGVDLSKLFAQSLSEEQSALLSLL